MNKRFAFVTAILLTLFIASCNHKTDDTEQLSDKEKLEILDVKIKKHPKSSILYYDRSQVYMRLQRTNDAIADLNKAICLDGKEIQYHIALGDAYFANGDIGNSYKALQEVLEIDKDNQEAYLKMGEISFYSRDYDRALENLSKVTEQDKTNRTALFMKAFVYKEKEDTASAVTLFRKVCDLYPDYEPAFEELGILYATRHDAMTVEYLTSAMRIDNKNTSPIYALAMYYQDLQQMDKAEELYKQILDIDNGHRDAWHNRGYIELFYYEDLDLAIEYFTQAIHSDAQFVEALSNRGLAYELKGNSKLAEQDYRAALDIDPHFQPASDGLQRIN